MTVYFASSDDIDFTMTGTQSVSTSSTVRDATYARSAVRVEGSTSSMKAVWDTKLPQFFMSCRRYQVSPHFSGANNELMLFEDGGVDVVRLKATGGTWSIQTWDGGWQSRVNLTNLMLGNTVMHISIKIVLHDTNGLVAVWVREVLAGSWVGDTIGDTGATGIDSALMRSSDDATNQDCYTSEVVIADEPTINMRVASMVMNADGDSTDFTNTYTAIDEAAVSDADIITSLSGNDEEIMNLVSYGGAADYAVPAIFVSARAMADVLSFLVLEDGLGNLLLEDGFSLNLEQGGGPQKLQLAVRHGATSGFSDDIVLTDVFANYIENFTINPDTGVPWIVADLAALQAGVKSIT